MVNTQQHLHGLRCTSVWVKWERDWSKWKIGFFESHHQHTWLLFVLLPSTSAKTNKPTHFFALSESEWSSVLNHPSSTWCHHRVKGLNNPKITIWIAPSPGSAPGSFSVGVGGLSWWLAGEITQSLNDYAKSFEDVVIYQRGLLKVNVGYSEHENNVR